MGEAARLRVIEQFTLRQTIDTFRAIYLELAARWNAGRARRRALGTAPAPVARSARMSGPVSPRTRRRRRTRWPCGWPRHATRRRPRWALDDATLAIRLPGARPATSEAVAHWPPNSPTGSAPAVHPYEVAALLEAEGLTGDQITGALRPPEPVLARRRPVRTGAAHASRSPPPTADPWRARPPCAALLRGVLFALPGLAYLLAAPAVARAHGARLGPDRRRARLPGPGARRLSHRAHLRLATGRREARPDAPGRAPRRCAGGHGRRGCCRRRSGGPVRWLRGRRSRLYLAAAGVLLVLRPGTAAAGRAQPTGRRRGGPAVVGAGPSAAGRAAAAGAARHARRRRRAAVRDRPRRRPAARRRRRGPRAAAAPCRTGCSGWPRGSLVLLEGRGEPCAVIVLTVSMGAGRVAALPLPRTLASPPCAPTAHAPPVPAAARAGILGALSRLGYLLPLLPPALLTGAEPAAAARCSRPLLWTALLLQAFGVAWPLGRGRRSRPRRRPGVGHASGLPPGAVVAARCAAAPPRRLVAGAPAGCSAGPPPTPDPSRR